MKNIKTSWSWAMWLFILGIVVQFALLASADAYPCWQVWETPPQGGNYLIGGYDGNGPSGPWGLLGACGGNFSPAFTATKDGVLYGLSYDSGQGALFRWSTSEGWQEWADCANNGGYFATVIINGNFLYVGGQFQGITTPGNPNTILVTNIAKLDLTSQTWSAVGDGSLMNGVDGNNNEVSAITVDAQGNVYAGFFLFYLDVFTYPVEPILKECPKNTGVWTTVGKGLVLASDSSIASDCMVNSGVDALATDGINIFVGGGFMGGVNTDSTITNSASVIKWDGTKWWQMGNRGIYDTQNPHVAYYVSSIVVSGTNVFTTGNYRYPSSGTPDLCSVGGFNLAQFSTNGSFISSHSLYYKSGGNYFPGLGWCLAAMPNGTVYLTGEFDTIDNVTAFQGIAQWNGQYKYWTNLDSTDGTHPINADLQWSSSYAFNGEGVGLSLASYSNVVYVLGLFDGLATHNYPGELNGFGRWATGPVVDATGLAITAQPLGNVMANEGGIVTISVTATGSPAFYQWRKNGANLTDGGEVSGSTNSTLTLTGVKTWDSGIYTVTVYNALNNVTSSYVALRVWDPSRVYAWGLNNSNQTTIPASCYNNVVAVSAGYEFSMALKSDGTVTNWGDNYYGEISKEPVGLNNVVAIAAGYSHCLALKNDGTVAAWGLDGLYQGERNGPIDVPSDLNNVVAIAGGGYHSLALKNNGTVVAWGYNGYGETNITGLSNVVAIAAGDFFSVALKNDGTVVTCGGWTPPAGLNNVVAIAAEGEDVVALKGDGTVVAWGYDLDGETDVPSDLQNPSLANVVAIAGGYEHGLALKGNGTVEAWGFNRFGQANVPSGLANVVAIAAGGFHNLVLIDPSLSAGTISSNSFSFNIAGPGGSYWDVYESSDLTNWTWTNGVTLSTNGTATFTDSAISGVSYRFYKLSNADCCLQPIGFTRVTVCPGTGINALIANQLDAPSNTLDGLFNIGVNHTMPDGSSLPAGSEIWKWYNSGWNNIYTWTGTSWDGGNGDGSSVTLAPGEGAFLVIPTNSPPVTVTFVGLVREGQLTIPLPKGYVSCVSSMLPEAGGIQSVLGYQPSKMDTVEVWNGSTFTVHKYLPGKGWTGGGEPVINVGEAVFIVPTTNETWQVNYSPCQ